MATRNDFKDFSEQDFINDKDFQDWVISSDEEKDRFWQVFLAKHPEKKEAIEKARALLMSIAFKELWPADEKVERSLTEALNTINQPSAKAPVHEIYNKRKPLYRTWMAAAAVLLFMAFGIWFLVGRDRTEKPSVAGTPKVEDIAPGGDKAILTLADGRRVVLDTAGNGAITRQGSVTVIKLNGQLAYQPSTSTSTPTLTYNIITTPRGGQFQLVLADGTKVWLNAASSLRFPTAFAEKERRVELTGEGYFEVAHDAAKPFHVQVNDMEVQVLGTHFNVNSYSDEPSIKTTLLEGSVKVRSGTQEAVLKPGQQAQLQATSHKLQTTNHVDVEQVMAWKNGLFVFNRADIETILRQAARWYDVDVEYGGKINETFSGGLPRSENISQLLKIFEATGKVTFTINGKKIMVQPK